MKILFNNYYAWWLACLDESTLSGEGVIMAIPLDDTDNMVSVRKHRSRCMGLMRHLGNSMNPNVSSVFFEKACFPIRSWEFQNKPDATDALELFKVEGLKVISPTDIAVFMCAETTWLHSRQIEWRMTTSSWRATAVHYAYVRHLLKGMGMPDDASGRLPQAIYDKMYPKLWCQPPDGSLTWEDALRMMCNVQMTQNRAMVYNEILAESENHGKPFTLALPKWSYYSNAPLVRRLVGVMHRDALLSWDVSKHRFMRGVERESFMRLNPVIAEENNKWFIKDPSRSNP